MMIIIIIMVILYIMANIMIQLQILRLKSV